MLVAEIYHIPDLQLPVEITAVHALHLPAHSGGFIEIVKSCHAAAIAQIQVLKARIESLIQDSRRFQRFHAEHGGVYLRRKDLSLFHISGDFRASSAHKRFCSCGKAPPGSADAVRIVC